MIGREPKRAFTTRLGGANTRGHIFDAVASISKAEVHVDTERLVIDVAFKLRRHIEPVASRREFNATAMVRHVLTRECPKHIGGAT